MVAKSLIETVGSGDEGQPGRAACPVVALITTKPVVERLAVY